MELPPHLLTEKLEQLKMIGWYGDLGGELVDQENYNVILEPKVTGLPDGQKWTTLNLPKSEELEKALKKYETREGFKNNTVLTLQAYSITHRGFSDGVSGVLWAKGHFRLSQYVDEGRSQEVCLNLETCSYAELVAYISGDVEGLANPNGLLVSMQTLTSDNKLIYTLRDNVSAGKGGIGIIGGTYDYEKKDGGKEHVPHPLMIAYGEVVEELGVKEEDVSVRLLTLMEDKYKRPVLEYSAILLLNADQIKELWEKNRELNDEHSELYFVDNTLEGLVNFANEHTPSEFHAPADLIFQQALMQKINEEKEKHNRQRDFVVAGTSPD